MKNWKCYDKKPGKIRNAKDLLKFFKLIPAGKWCVNALENSKGQRCAMGHLNAAYSRNAFDVSKHLTNGFSWSEIVTTNNGENLRRPTTTGKAIKSRIIRFITNNIDR